MQMTYLFKLKEAREVYRRRNKHSTTQYAECSGTPVKLFLLRPGPAFLIGSSGGGVPDQMGFVREGMDG